MRGLHFAATAAHAKIADALTHQVTQTLRPFQQYLRQAVLTAKSRQIRNKLPWERVPALHTLELVPLDSLLYMRRPAAAWIIEGWPAERRADVSQPLMVVNRGAVVRVLSVQQREDGLHLRLEAPVAATDQIFFCGHPCKVTERPVSKPTEICDGKGQRFAIAECSEHDADRWLLRLSGRPDGGPFTVEGVAVDAEQVGDLDGLRLLRDAAGRAFQLTDGKIRTDEQPAAGPLQSEDGRRFTWKSAGGRQGNWVQLLLPKELGGDDAMDPRAAFCADDVKAVWTERHYDKDAVIQVYRVDRERYQLQVERLPPPDKDLLYLPIDLRSLYLQQRALRQLAIAPLPHHQGLLRLCEQPERVQWPQVVERIPPAWFELTSDSYSGTGEQRTFVARALGSPDLMLLEGPPGSGKTTAICELIRQCAAAGQRVLLCASTNVAIDNVIEKLMLAQSGLEIVRIGAPDKVDPKVADCRLESRVDALAQEWRRVPGLSQLGDGELRGAAERTVIQAASLTCGTTMGIINHPLFRGRDQDLEAWNRPIATLPHWDVLIIDEASKTTVQEFLVPALMARRWVIVGDVRQLPPFTERSDLTANLSSLTDADNRSLFPPEHQRACLLRGRLERWHAPGTRWLVVERAGVLRCLVDELRARAGDPQTRQLSVVHITSYGRTSGAAPVVELPVGELLSGEPAALHLYTADWVLVDEELLARISDRLPGDLLHCRELVALDAELFERCALRFRQAHFFAHGPPLTRTIRERDKRMERPRQLQAHAQDWLTRHAFADEAAWRLIRLHELRRSRRDGECARLREELKRLLPAAVDIHEPIEEIQDIALPSILETLQEGIGEERAKRRSGLTCGLAGSQALQLRFVSLSFQHRMHPHISGFAREVFYEGKALHDANTIAARDRTVRWDFAPRWPARRLFLDVHGTEHHGVNGAEVEVLIEILRGFVAWARRAGPPPSRRSQRWEVACLSFYVRQEMAIRDALRELTRQRDQHTRFSAENVEIVSGTVDRFQGREADLVLLSMRNTGRIGFLDSPNRLNVALTRGRQQLCIAGRAGYFARCDVSELEALVQKSACLPATEALRGLR